MPETMPTTETSKAPPLHSVPPKASRAKKESCGTVAPRVTLSVEPDTAAAAPVSLKVRPDLTLATYAAGVHASVPYEPEVALAHWRESVMDRAEQARALDVLLAQNAELTAEVTAYADEMGELLDDLKKANLPPDLRCKGRHLLMLLEIDKGETVAAIADSLQTVAYDMRSRFVPKYKGKVKVALTCTADPNDMDSMIVSAEVSPETPAQATGGRLSLASDGTVVTRKESAQAFQLKLQEPEPDPLAEMFGKADGEAFGALLRAKGVREITLGEGDNKVKVRLAGKSTQKAA